MFSCKSQNQINNQCTEPKFFSLSIIHYTWIYVKYKRKKYGFYDVYFATVLDEHPKQCIGLNALAVCVYRWWYMMEPTAREEDIKCVKESKQKQESLLHTQKWWSAERRCGSDACTKMWCATSRLWQDVLEHFVLLGLHLVHHVLFLFCLHVFGSCCISYVIWTAPEFVWKWTITCLFRGLNPVAL